MTEKKEIERLMQPRYEVIADWPDNPFVVGAILNERIDDNDGKKYLQHEIEEHNWLIWEPELFPHLLKKLSWWEHRKPEEIKSVKFLKDTGDGEIFQAECTNTGMCYVKLNNKRQGDLRYTSLQHFPPPPPPSPNTTNKLKQ